MNYSASCEQSPVIFCQGIHNRHMKLKCLCETSCSWHVVSLMWGNVLNIAVPRNMQFNRDYILRKSTELLSNEVKCIFKDCFALKCSKRTFKACNFMFATTVLENILTL